MKIFLVVVIVLCIITLVNVLIESYRRKQKNLVFKLSTA